MNETVRVCELENESEGNLICSVLDDKQIPYVLKTMRDSAYDGLYVSQGPWGFLEAPAEYFDQVSQIARDLLERRRAQQQQPIVGRRKRSVIGKVIVGLLIFLFIVLIALAVSYYGRYGL